MSVAISERHGQLLEFIKSRALRTGDVTLSSGEQSNYYIDGKLIEVHPASAYLIGEVLADELQGLDVAAVGGLATGAIPLVTSTVIACHHRREAIEGFWVRDQAKEHGTKKIIEGDLQPNSRVAIVDDVVTSGGSVLKAIQAVEERDCEVAAIISLVDRDGGARELFDQHGYSYRPLFTKDDVLST